ncbi:hypothetical protein DFP72DRAFT_589833 [Ephemerocybe angulata]|uniref:Uncharacterized protein n=1 Tax=Ephemerocybe angulata TaxID=980116 RepID=A0A8H6HJ06_9AGAR|nr:hypothetical protein DFP72DRAFT_589833 [Tulosesus angulatus]
MSNGCEKSPKRQIPTPPPRRTRIRAQSPTPDANFVLIEHRERTPSQRTNDSGAWPHGRQCSRFLGDMERGTRRADTRAMGERKRCRKGVKRTGAQKKGERRHARQSTSEAKELSSQPHLPSRLNPSTIADPQNDSTKKSSTASKYTVKELTTRAVPARHRRSFDTWSHRARDSSRRYLSDVIEKRGHEKRGAHTKPTGTKRRPKTNGETNRIKRETKHIGKSTRSEANRRGTKGR